MGAAASAVSASGARPLAHAHHQKRPAPPAYSRAVEDRSAVEPARGRNIVVIGHDEMTEVTERALNTAGATVTYLRDPHDRAIRRALDDDVDAVVIISNDDHVSLRLALVVENVRPGVPLVVTVFGGIVASQLRRAVRNVRVIGMADMVVPSLAGPCLDERLLSVSRRDGGFAGVQAGPGARKSSRSSTTCRHAGSGS